VSSKIRILAVDDDAVVCLMLTLMLSDERYTVETTQSVDTALAAIEQNPFDVYVMDYKLPDGSGLDIAERIRSKGSEAPIIMISGYDPKEIALRAGKFHIFGYLQKPFSRPMICDVVKKAIGELPRIALR
jgi:DNA-binding NtrC family response regulator